MAGGKQTDPAVAATAKVMHEMGFEPGLISEVTELNQRTVNDIIRGNGSWNQMPSSELVDVTRERVRSIIESVSNDLAMKVPARLNQRLEKASYLECLHS